jgi:hypothetical protein
VHGKDDLGITRLTFRGWQWFAQLFSRRRRCEDISISIQEHIEERTEELVADGTARKQVEQTARREFGNVTLLEERSREVWQWPGVRVHAGRPEICLPPAAKIAGWFVIGQKENREISAAENPPLQLTIVRN